MSAAKQTVYANRHLFRLPGGPSYGTTPRVDLATHAKKRLEVLDSKSPTLWTVRNFQKVIDV